MFNKCLRRSSIHWGNYSRCCLRWHEISTPLLNPAGLLTGVRCKPRSAWQVTWKVRRRKELARGSLARTYLEARAAIETLVVRAKQPWESPVKVDKVSPSVDGSWAFSIHRGSDLLYRLLVTCFVFIDPKSVPQSEMHVNVCLEDGLMDRVRCPVLPCGNDGRA